MSKAPSRKPVRFLADLTRAMHSAAEAEREATLGQFQVEAKAYVEEIHARSATEATDLRQRADDDVAGIREWSKAEIARIREETEHKIADRKATLDTELEEHAARIEREIDRVQGHVAAFEARMATFFEELLREEDPTRLASLAQSLPEPPPFDELSQEDTDQPDPQPEEGAGAVVGASVDASADEAGEATEGAANAAEADPAEAAADAAGTGDEILGSAEPDGDATTSDDPRLAMLTMTPDFEAAEAEAAAAFGASDALEGDGSEDQPGDVPEIGGEALSARLAGLVGPRGQKQAAESAATETTRVVVRGLISVASIAGFKRHLGRLAGVQSVGVSSTPDGEFIFTVAHGADVDLTQAVPGLPGFGARILSSGEGLLNVTARDPEPSSYTPASSS